jgi:hypothetical protein
MTNPLRHCRFSISDFRLKPNSGDAFQLAIGNRKSSGLFFASFSRAGLQRSSLIAFSQLTT